MARKLIDRRFVVYEVEEYIFLADQQYPGSLKFERLSMGTCGRRFCRALNQMVGFSG